jgi:F-type H+-transporting ATPase subunit epsilon
MVLEIISPEKQLFKGVIQSVQLPGSDGSFGVLDNHAPLIASLKKGTVKITSVTQQEQSFEINGGVVEVLNNNVIVLAG